MSEITLHIIQLQKLYFQKMPIFLGEFRVDNYYILQYIILFLCNIYHSTHFFMWKCESVEVARTTYSLLKYINISQQARFSKIEQQIISNNDEHPKL